MLDINQIKKLLPHRYPFLLVDRVLEITPDKLKAIKNVTFNEPHFTGHFPNYPVMPGVLIVEALAQCAGIHSIYNSGEEPENMLTLFMGIDGVKFRKQVVPGDQLMLEITLLRSRRGIVKVKAEAFVDGELACEGELTAMMTPMEK